MKEVIGKEEGKTALIKAVNLLCNVVSSTLGPTGKNVLIHNSDMAPFITNDGVTIARNIESDDKKINTVLEIVKEASLKTNEEVGDGTTTTLVLLQSIFNQGEEEIQLGKNPILLKKELLSALNNAIEEIKKNKKVPNKKDMKSIASISANDEEIGALTSELFFKMKSKHSIRLEESHKENTSFDIKKGYNLEIENISSMYFQKEKEINLKDSYVLVIKGYLSSLEQISEIINEGLKAGKNIIIFVEELEETIQQELLVYYLTEHKNIFIIKLPEYASRREKIETDIAILSSCNIKNMDYEKVYFKDLGTVEDIQITKNEIILSTDNKKTEKLQKELMWELQNSYNEYEKEFIATRLSKLKNGIVTIYVGGNTKTEIKEKLMHYEDALCSLEVAKEGVVLGEGVALLKVSSKLKENTTGEKIIKRALEVPFEKIAKNAGQDEKELKRKIIESNYQYLYNFETNQLEGSKDTKILDPLRVVLTALKNAVSIASILLTTDYLVLNERNEFEKDIL